MPAGGDAAGNSSVRETLPSPAPEKAATVATSATHDRRNVAAVADVAASPGMEEEGDQGLDL